MTKKIINNNSNNNKNFNLFKQFLYSGLNTNNK